MRIEEIGSLIGQGNYSWVYSINDNPNLAIKVSKSQSNSLQQQSLILQKLSLSSLFPKFVRMDLMSIKQDQENRQNQLQCLIIEKLGLSLIELMTLRKGVLSISTIKSISKQLLEQIKYIHSINLCHNDIKPQNIVFGRNENRTKCYIIDFGLASYVDTHSMVNDQTNIAQIFRGNIQYAALSKLGGQNSSCMQDLQSIMYIILLMLENGSPKWYQYDINRNSTVDSRLLIAKRNKQLYLFNNQQIKNDSKSIFISQIKDLIKSIYVNKRSYLDVLQQLYLIFQ